MAIAAGRFGRFILQTCLLGLLLIGIVTASPGDRSQVFHACLQKCFAENCTDIIHDTRDFHLKLLQWSCEDECKYLCMWSTVDWFADKGIDVQQFFGKWPFIRIMGIQEFASTVFSLLNLICHIAMIREFRRKVSSSAPFYYVVHAYCLVCSNGWLWSAVFHTRDLRFTEIMDYLSAFSMILFSLFHLIIRFKGTYGNDWLSLAISFALGFFFFYHSYTVFFIQMDYGYNMICSIILGVVNVFGWLIWCWHHKIRQPYVWRCAVFVALVAITTLLEIADFPPFFWLLDAHALWHLSTIPLPVLWYRFLIDDCHHLQYQKQIMNKRA